MFYRPAGVFFVVLSDPGHTKTASKSVSEFGFCLWMTLSILQMSHDELRSMLWIVPAGVGAAFEQSTRGEGSQGEPGVDSILNVDFVQDHIAGM